MVFTLKAPVNLLKMLKGTWPFSLLVEKFNIFYYANIVNFFNCLKQDATYFTMEPILVAWVVEVVNLHITLP